MENVCSVLFSQLSREPSSRGREDNQVPVVSSRWVVSLLLTACPRLNLLVNRGAPSERHRPPLCSPGVGFHAVAPKLLGLEWK